MKNKCPLSPKEAAAELGSSVKTVHRWDAAGKLHTVRTADNQRRIPIEELSRVRRFFREEQGAERAALYARVSSVRQEQDSNLARQTARLQEAARARGYEVVAIISEQTSSLNEKRKGMRKLLQIVKERAIEVMLIEYPDRLVRFSFGYLEETFSWQGVRLEVLDPPKHLEPTAELVQDHLMIVTVFAERLYGSRAKSVRARIKAALKEVKEETDGADTADHEARA